MIFSLALLKENKKEVEGETREREKMKGYFITYLV